MILYKYRNDTKELIGFFEAYIDPLESSKQNKPVYVFPPDTTIVAPDTPREGYVQVFNGEKWEEVEDNRGKVVWKNGKDPFTITLLGPIPDDCTTEKTLSLRELKDMKFKEIKSAYYKAYNDKIKVGKLEVCIDRAASLKNASTAFKDYKEFVFEEEVITHGEANEAIELLYERSMDLVKKKKELEEKVRNSKSKEDVENLKVLF